MEHERPKRFVRVADVLMISEPGDRQTHLSMLNEICNSGLDAEQANKLLYLEPSGRYDMGILMKVDENVMMFGSNSTELHYPEGRQDLEEIRVITKKLLESRFTEFTIEDF